MAVTRKDVAREAGVSPGVVSYVLNNGPRPVSAESRRRVLEAVQRLGYLRDGSARSLRMGRTQTIGLVIPDVSNPFFAELARAIEDAAYRRDHALLVCNSANAVEREQSYVQSLAERRVDGLILVSASEDQDLSGLTRLAIPVVALDRPPQSGTVSTIHARNHHAAYAGTEHLIGHGHSRIALIAGHGHGVSGERLAGWRQALAHHALPEGVIVRSSFTLAGGYEAGTALVSSRDRPKAVVVASDVQAIGALGAIREHGLKVPEDLAVVSIDGTQAAGYAAPPLTTVAQQITPMSEAAVDHLLTRPDDLVSLTFDNELVTRASCGCRSARQ